MISIDAKKLKLMFYYGKKLIFDNYEYINKLNVFPIPDADTGTNLMVTTSQAYANVESLKNVDDLQMITKTFADGLLMNSQGNSGVIFSQIFQGFANSFTIHQKQASIPNLITAFHNAKDCAYKSVVSPKEGTILTIIRHVSEKLDKTKNDFKSIDELFKFVWTEAENALSTTPNYLPQLKNAGVVDSGGFGLTKFFEGMYHAINNEDKKIEKNNYQKSQIDKTTKIIGDFPDDNQGFGYCCEFILQIGTKVVAKQSNKSTFYEKTFKNKIQSMGESFVYIKNNDIVKVHVHVVKPYKLLEYAAKFGEFNKVKITNMTYQFKQKNANNLKEDENIASELIYPITSSVPKICTIVPTNELKEIYNVNFKIFDLINCKKNLSIQDIYFLIKNCDSQSIIFVTNNLDTIDGIKEAISLIENEKEKIELICAPDLAINYLACLAFNPNNSFTHNCKIMNKILKNTIVGKISKSNRETKYGKIHIKINDFIGIYDDNVLLVDNDFQSITKKFINKLFNLVHKPKNIVLFYKNTISSSDLNTIKKYIVEEYEIKPSLVACGDISYELYIAIVNK